MASNLEMQKSGVIINSVGGSCDTCLIIRDVVYLTPAGVQLCPDCYMEKNRPTIYFTKRSKHGYLWSRENQTTEHVNISTIKNCGWFLREETEDKSQGNGVVVYTYKLEYYGNKACPRCEGIEFSKNAPKCHNYHCSASVRKKGYDFDI